MENSTKLYHIGGDEFSVLSRHWDIRTTEETLSLAREHTHNSGVSFAFGSVAYDPAASIYQVLPLADRACADMLYGQSVPSE